MKRRDPTFLLALVAALALHLILLRVSTRAASRDLGWWLQSSVAQARQAADLVAPPPPPPQALIGENNGTGKSINRMPGDRPQQSELSDPEQEQTLADRSQVGFGKSPTAKPLAELLKGNNGQSNSGQGKGPLNGQSDLAQAPAPKSSKTPPIKSQQKPNNSQSPATPPLVLVDPKAPNNIAPAQNPLASGPLAAKPVKPSPPQSPQQPDQQQQTDQQNPTPAQQPSGGKAGAPDSGAGKPVPTAEFESEPFALYATQLQPGRVIAQHGRKLITREIPDIDVRGQVDLEDALTAVVVLHIKLDDKGNVTEAKTIHSSGSDAVDLPCERAAETWWFEPRKDPDTGKPTPDEFDFAIKFK